VEPRDKGSFERLVGAAWSISGLVAGLVFLGGVIVWAAHHPGIGPLMIVGSFLLIVLQAFVTQNKDLRALNAALVAERATKGRRREVRAHLGVFLARSTEILSAAKQELQVRAKTAAHTQGGFENDEPQVDHVILVDERTWQQELENYLEEAPELGPSYVADMRAGVTALGTNPSAPFSLFAQLQQVCKVVEYKQGQIRAILSDFRE
jgi:hypothetical protein